MTTEVRYLAQHLLHAGVAPLGARDRRILLRIARRMHAARDETDLAEAGATFGQRLADRVAAIGGSWAFIACFCAFLVAWAGLNAVVLSERAFDPYPFVFLNLILSMVAALQAPVIMMSQNRQATKDRLSAALAFEVGVQADARIADLHAKVDALGERIERLLAANAAPPQEEAVEDGCPLLRAA